MLTANIKARLALMREPPNESTRYDAVERYIEELMRGAEDVATLQALVERTHNSELMLRFAALVPGADTDQVLALVAVAQVIES